MAKKKREIKHLDLDEVFGVNAPIQVKWGGRNHELTRPEALGAKQLAQLESLQKKAGELNDFGEDISDEDAAKMEDVIESAVALVGPSLPIDTLPFMAKARILFFYQRETGLITDEDLNPESGTSEKDPKEEQAGN